MNDSKEIDKLINIGSDIKFINYLHQKSELAKIRKDNMWRLLQKKLPCWEK